MKITDKITITNEDCMDLLRRTPDKYYSLALVDPPYGINACENLAKNNGKKYGGKTLARRNTYKSKDWDTSSPNVEYFNELIRVSKNQIIWGANHFISKIPYNSSCWIVWDKKTNGAFADCELAYTSFNTAVRKFEYTWNGMLQGDMKNKEERIHPTQKPVALYKWILDKYAKEGDKILDTHLGSGSIAIAAHDYGFELTCCELDVDYYNKAVERIKNHVSQLKLF